MGYRGKIAEQNRARDLRAQGWTYGEIVAELGVARSSVSLWVRDVAVDPTLLDARRKAVRSRSYRSGTRRPSSLQLAKEADIDARRRASAEHIGELSDRDLLVAGAALYAGEGFKTGGAVGFANTDPAMVRLFLRWYRRFFEVEEPRLRVRVYLHEGLDLRAATLFWSETTGVPEWQFGKAYRAVDDPTRRKAKHPMGCATVRYSSIHHLRSVLGLVDALLHSATPLPG